MKQYSGAVLFIDMLGIGALTQGKIELQDREYAAWDVATSEIGKHHILGAKLLMQFRRSLLHTRKTWGTVKVAQLSDCAFLWGQDPVAVTNAAREVMWHVTRAGLLCRAGLAYGQIIEPDKVNQSLGQFVLGEAVTKAVGYETAGKGARVFCDPEVAYEVLKTCRFKRKPFAPLKNPLDGTIVDEFRWYLLPQPFEQVDEGSEKARTTVLALVELLTMLRYSPRLGWNAASREGKLQIACSIESVSEMISAYVHNDNYSFTVEHLMAAETSPSRSEELLARIKKQFEGEISELVRPLKGRLAQAR